MNLFIPTDIIQSFCERHHIQKFALFGSVLRDDFRPDSDVDVLVDFQPKHVPGFIRLVQMQDELSDLLGRSVDLNTALSLSPRFRKKVLDSVQVLYERA